MSGIGVHDVEFTKNQKSYKDKKKKKEKQKKNGCMVKQISLFIIYIASFL